MKSLEESVVVAMDGSDINLFPFLPYILQDIWEIGSDPETIASLIEKHFEKFDHLKILDLGCGKGAVSIGIAEKLGCSCYGIDGIPPFITDAKRKAIEHKVESLCQFEIGDIREKVQELKNYDIIILGSIGPVFGDYHRTLSTLSHCINDSGMIIIDDGYIEDTSDYTHPQIWKKQQILQQIELAGMKLIDEYIINGDSIKDSDDFIFSNLNKRCLELINQYPDKKELFENYIRKQEEENDVLENKIICSSMVVKKIKL